MKITYQRKLTLSFLAIFILFTVGIVIFEQRQARKYKTEALEERLDAYADMVEKYLPAANAPWHTDSLLRLLPQNIRLTLISADGTVTYDNLFADADALDNHAGRPEVGDARQRGEGSFVRTSASNSQPYLYYAKYYGNGYVRVALPYDIEVQSFLKPDNGFLYFIVALFIVGLLFIHYVGGRFGKSVRKLRDFSEAVSDGRSNIKIPRFAGDELGEISERIARDYKKVIESESQLRQEREKLLQHVQSSAEGICFFNPDRRVAFYNGLFLQHLNTLSRNTVSHLSDLLAEDVFVPVLDFLDNRQNDNYFEARIAKQGKDFLVRVNIFEDESLEVILNDVTAQEKTRRLKQEMTGNIAHELRTPVTSIRGFLETVIENNLDRVKEHDFLKKAYEQTKNLSELISDMGLLTKIEQNPAAYGRKNVHIAEIIRKVEADLSDGLKGKSIRIESSVPDTLVVNGNETLLYSIFRNLAENVICHAGENITVFIRNCDSKNGRAFFSFADTGRGIEDEMVLSRLFERFYRVGDGRTREAGGSGLGLSIVKNAVLLHGGNIVVKNRDGGGLEFLFDLAFTMPVE